MLKWRKQKIFKNQVCDIMVGFRNGNTDVDTVVNESLSEKVIFES